MNTSLLTLFVVLAAIAAISHRRGAFVVAVGATVLAAMPAWALVRTSHPLLVGAMALALAGWLWMRHGRTMATVTRWGSSSRRKAGVASTGDIVRAGSALAMRRRTPQVRPSLRATSRWARLVQLVRLPAVAVGVELCQVAGLKVWASIEDVVLAFGGPRVGKSQWLAGRIIDAPGAVLVTSTRTDLLNQTAALRAQVGPVFVFNPVGLGGLPSTITFDPLTDCDDPVAANERAADMLAAANRGGGPDREFWDDQGRRNLAALMHAAALGGHTMADVGTWLSELDDHQQRILLLLRNRSPEPAFEAAVRQFIGTNERTRTSITSTIAPAIGWLTHGPAKQAARPIAEGGQPFDVAALLAAKVTVYMLGGEEAQVAPLVCALTGYIARQARRLADRQPGGRLDPPLSLRLDEAALICPIPLDKWSADMGGRGISIVACFQSRAQLVDCYGVAKSAVTLNNSGARELFGGTADRDDLNYWSTLAGERDEPTTTTDLHGRLASRTTRRVPVLSPAQLANLPAGRVVVFRRDMPPVIGRVEQAWRRADVHAVHHPDALTVRARAWRRQQVTRAAAVIARRTRPARTWFGARRRAVVGWCAARWTALRVRVTGRGGPIRYESPTVVPGQVVDQRRGPHEAEVIPFPQLPGSEPDDPWGDAR
ncbi:type IV secretory system conjugative DNA transfer family protein [Pseudonocardia abyssalis]|uniref:TraM recognition domain-containing protein n=1 Tax=Pseudonocardia abyssalis TaxID=2792008 RepID=A0ABS6V132_9PSEU|nr:TraM recognition domain-containing protein [Pseudonocardia abyssalis]MBW0114044.1 TraM recognition domain-containing protein [Pseudonocardia abyssalis]MBW0137669.1 TraM recognition domain-containing protein [Pseudonocardia abyssalis]